MANYWIDYSFVIPNLTDEQLDWWDKKLEELEKLRDTDGYDLDDLDEDGDPKEGAVSKYDWADFGSPGGSFEMQRQKNRIWVTGAFNEGGNINGMIAVIQEYITTMDPTRIVGYEWSRTCSKPRLDAYGGGTVVISKDNVKRMSTNTLMEKYMKEMKEEIGNG